MKSHSRQSSSVILVGNKACKKRSALRRLILLCVALANHSQVLHDFQVIYRCRLPTQSGTGVAAYS